MDALDFAIGELSTAGRVAALLDRHAEVQADRAIENRRTMREGAEAARKLQEMGLIETQPHTYDTGEDDDSVDTELEGENKDGRRTREVLQYLRENPESTVADACRKHSLTRSAFYNTRARMRKRGEA